METAKLFQNGSSQAVRLPKGCRFSGDEVYVRKVGTAVVLYPKNQVWETFLNGLDGFSEDFLAQGRSQGAPQDRDSL